MSLRPRTAVFALFMPLAVTLCAAAPPEEGKEFRGGAGYDYFEYQSGGCSSPSYVNRAHEGRGAASVSYRHTSGFTAVGDSSFGVAKVTDSTLETPPEEIEPGDDLSGDDRGRTIVSGLLVGRLGFHWDYFGVELGGGGAINVGSLNVFDDTVYAIPSGSIWVGYPRILYLFANAGTSPASAGYLPIEFGLGHASEGLRLEAGLTESSSAMVHAQMPIDDIWLGAKLHLSATERSENEILHSGGGLITLSTSF